jgi:PEGA domain
VALKPIFRWSVAWLLFARGVGAAPDDPSPSSVTSPATPEDPLVQRKAVAEERRQRALQLYDAGEYGKARSEFEEANHLMPSFRLLYNLGVVSLALGDFANAYDYFQHYLSEGGGSVPSDSRAQVDSQVQELSQQIASVAVGVDVPGAQVFVDEVAVGQTPLIKALHLNPGMHHFLARLGGARSATRTLELARGESTHIELQLLRAPKTAAPKKTDGPTAPVPWLGWAGTAALAVGASAAGLEALGAQKNYQRRFESIGTTRGELDRLDARTRTWSITADVLGGAALVAGSYCLYLTLRRSKQASAADAPTTLTVQLGPPHALFGVHF